MVGGLESVIEISFVVSTVIGTVSWTVSVRMVDFRSSSVSITTRVSLGRVGAGTSEVVVDPAGLGTAMLVQEGREPVECIDGFMDSVQLHSVSVLRDSWVTVMISPSEAITHIPSDSRRAIAKNPEGAMMGNFGGGGLKLGFVDNLFIHIVTHYRAERTTKRIGQDTIVKAKKYNLITQKP